MSTETNNPVGLKKSKNKMTKLVLEQLTSGVAITKDWLGMESLDDSDMES